MITTTDLNHIQDLLVCKKWAELRQLLAPIAPSEIAEVLKDFFKTDRILLFRCLGREQAADAFSYLDDNQQKQLLAELNDQETRDVLAHLSPDDRTELFEELPASVTKRLLEFLSPEDRKEALMLLGYPENSVGRLMSPDFASVRPEMTVAEAMASIEKQAPDSETLNMIYVTDDHGRLLDEVRLRRFITSPKDRKVSDLMDGKFSALQATQPEEDAVKLMQAKGYFALPVTDVKGVLLGVVTADDVLDVAVEGRPRTSTKAEPSSRWK